jgi:protein tyrosine/serine phosphatase
VYSLRIVPSEYNINPDSHYSRGAMTSENSPPLPSPPFYTNIPNINNLRLATSSLTTKSGSTLRPGVLFRSAEVSKLDTPGWTAVRNIGIARVFDLRSKPEVDKGWAGIVGKDANGTEDVRPGWIQAMEEAGVKRTWTPVFEESDYSPERLAERYSKYMDESVKGFVEAYADILRNGGMAFGTILRYLASLSPADGREKDGGEGEKLGALIHCTAGKDRTGIFFGLLFDFLGVPREQIADEYQLTELGLCHIREEVVARLITSPGFRKYMLAQTSGTTLSAEDIAKSIRGEDGDGSTTSEILPEILEKGRQAALRMVGARKESMIKSLDMLDERFGGAERYMREVCGLGEEQLEDLKRNLIVDHENGVAK